MITDNALRDDTQAASLKNDHCKNEQTSQNVDNFILHQKKCSLTLITMSLTG